MKVGQKATYVLHFTDEAIKEYSIPYDSMIVKFNVIEHGGFQYGNQTAVVVETEEQKRCYDTRYWNGTFDECCRQIINDIWRENVKSINLLN